MNAGIASCCVIQCSARRGVVNEEQYILCYKVCFICFNIVKSILFYNENFTLLPVYLRTELKQRITDVENKSLIIINHDSFGNYI